MIKLSNILLEKEDDGYVSIGFGRFKKKGQEDKDDADVYVKTDKGQFVKTKDQSSDDKGDDSEKKEKPKVNIFDKPKGDKPKGDDDDTNADGYPADVYSDQEIVDIVDKDVDEIKAMLYGKNPLAKYMSKKDEKYIQQHLDALKDTSSLPTGKEDFHRDELFLPISRAQMNQKQGKVQQGERFSGDRKFLPKSKDENYNPSDKFLTESIDLLKRDFGQPLPTLQSVMEKHQKNVKEGPDDVRITKRQLQMLIKQEGEFRKRMMNIEQGFLRDPRPENKKLAKDIKKSYKDNVTKFMREVVGMLKRMK
tara:strand:- start:1288 stop:2208 length:921 start_codon:yes stop_codon:yes gene_type:complete